MPDITMPRLSDTMADGVITTWRKQQGDPVRSGDVLAEIETDKAIMELEAYDDGVLERVLVAEGERVPIGTPIAVVGDGSGSAFEPAPQAAQPEPAPPAPAAEPTPAPTPAPAAPAPAPSRRPPASPLARKIAKELGVDLAGVSGTGPNGRIIRADIEAAAAAPAPEPATPAPAPAPVVAADAEEVPLTTLQRVAAKRLTESKQQAPHFYLTAAADVTELVAFRAGLNETLQAAGGPKVSLNDLVVKAVAAVLRAHPAVNVSFGGDLLLRHRGIHLGVAVAVPGGLLVPVIRDADRKSVSEIAAEGRDKAVRGRDGTLRADEMSGGTFTISNLGMFGVEQFAAVINPPEAAILAVGAATEEVRVVDGEFAARRILRVTLSADHRAIDGATGAAFLRDLTALLEQPLRILA
ncbi:dihydrolipoamide acetyltransferase family protein [Pseudonocardia nigra]|uniref:dihydrolipoamide acetyltransferase family protein n=1 Tax=Pseudonocardia nigra TaxID=1921578 RepID=UPI001C5FAA81|nr:dihydrolipoamide acetyltransferase family protein [Pseudonocardia nigra]